MRNVWLLLVLVLSACGDGSQREGACRFVQNGLTICRVSVTREAWIRSLPPGAYVDLDRACRSMSGAVVTECASNTASGSCVFNNRMISVDTERYATTLAAARMYCAREGGQWTDDR